MDNRIESEVKDLEDEAGDLEAGKIKAGKMKVAENKVGGSEASEDGYWGGLEHR